MKIKKKIILLCSLLLMLLLSGCTRQEYNVNINNNDNVDFSIKVLINKESYNLLSSFGIDTNELEENKIEGTGTEVDNVNVLFQETAMTLQGYGFQITALDDAVELGFSAKKTYLTIEEFNDEIKKLCENNVSGLNLNIQYSNTKNHKEYKAYGTINYLIDEDMGLDDSTIKSYFDEQYDTSDMTATVYINMPLSTQITNHDGTDSGNGIQWTTSYTDGEKEVHVISSYNDNTIIYIIIFIVVIILLVIAFFVLRALKFKKEKDNSALADVYEEERENS